MLGLGIFTLVFATTTASAILLVGTLDFNVCDPCVRGRKGAGRDTGLRRWRQKAALPEEANDVEGF